MRQKKKLNRPKMGSRQLSLCPEFASADIHALSGHAILVGRLNDSEQSPGSSDFLGDGKGTSPFRTAKLQRGPKKFVTSGYYDCIFPWKERSHGVVNE